MLIGKNCQLIDAQDEEKNTPLHLAAETGHHEIVEFLIKADADVDVE